MQNEAAFDEIFQQANFNTFVFRNRVKLETYNVSRTGMVISLIKCLWIYCYAYWVGYVKKMRLPQIP